MRHIYHDRMQKDIHLNWQVYQIEIYNVSMQLHTREY